jgi:amidase
MTTPAPGPSAPVAFAKTFPQKLRIGVVEDTGLLFPTAVDRAEAVLEASRVLEAQGHVLHPVQAADLATIAQGCGDVFEGIVSINLAALAHEPGNDFSLSEKITQAALSTGKEISGVQLWQLMQSMVQLSHDFARLFDEVDCLLMPMLSSQPVRLGAFPTDHSDCGLHFKRMAGFAPLATIANVTGCPALTLPFGKDGDGLPLPVQLMVPMGHDRLTLKLAESLEMQERWQQRFLVAGMVQ